MQAKSTRALATSASPRQLKRHVARGDGDAAPASATTSAVRLTMARTVADAVSTCTGLAAPSSIGPIVMLLPAAVLSRLYEMFAASMFGSTSRFASPSSVDSG